MSSARSNNYWTRIKAAIATPLILFILLIIVWAILLPSSAEGSEVTFRSYPIANTFFWIWLLSIPSSVVVLIHSIWKDKQELSKDFLKINQRHWITIGIFSFFTCGFYFLWYLYARYRRTKSDVAGKSGSTVSPSNSNDFRTPKRNSVAERNNDRSATLDASSSSDTEQNIAEFEAEQQKAGTSQVTEEKKKEIERELSSIHSEFERIDYSTTGIAKVENILDNIESRLESLMQEASEQGFDELKTEAQNLEQEISNRQAREEKKKEIEKELDSIRSDLYKIDSLVTDGEYQKAEKRVDKIKSAILSLKKQVSLEKFDSLENKLQRLERKCDKRLSESHVLTQIRKIDPYEFEEFVAKIWEKQGWDAEATTGSADRGVDVVATKEDTFEKRRHLIQVKRHGANTKVGSEDIQRYASLYQRDEQVDNVFVVTSNQFTSEAEEVANRRDVSTVNGNELYEMLTET